MSDLTIYLEQYGLLSLEKQLKLRSLVGDHSRELDLDAGLIRFSGGLEFPFQILGTESDNTLTWLWAWAEEQAEAPPELLTASREMKAWGEKEGLKECTLPSVDLDRADGQRLALIASEVCRASCYYQDSYDGGALFLLLFSREIDALPALDAAGLAEQASHLASLHDVDLRNALRSYFGRHGLPFEEAGDALAGRLATGERFSAEFDADGRMLPPRGRTGEE